MVTESRLTRHILLIHWIHFSEKYPIFCNLFHNLSFKVKYLHWKEEKKKGSQISGRIILNSLGVSQDNSGCQIRLLPPLFQRSFTVIPEACLELGSKTIKKVSESELVVLLFSFPDLHPKLLTGLHIRWNSYGKTKKNHGYQRLGSENHKQRNTD